MLRERSARRKTEGGDGARQEDRDKDRGQDRDRDRRSEAAPGAGTDRAAGRAQAAPSSACGTSAITDSSSLPCHPEGAAHLTPARRGRPCLGGKRLQGRKPRNAPTGWCCASQKRGKTAGKYSQEMSFYSISAGALRSHGPEGARPAGLCPAGDGHQFIAALLREVFRPPSGLHPTAAKVLVRHPSSFPGIKEPNESGGIPSLRGKGVWSSVAAWSRLRGSVSSRFS
ncbi:uncharacterized protein LOC135408149 isoform X2 [Pseudopipra pipra]|uniref:uncharacterized protein LOC135408149 isoform X2 n=1 Tax=Pseudopipra pipra TaxID=415032 RepID=UPI0031398C2B